MLLHMVFSTVKENCALLGGFFLCCSSCCVIVGFGCAVCCIGFRCHIIRVMLTGVDGKAEEGRGHAVYGCRNGCMCLVWV
jgi:hypothetical protein